MKRLGAGTAGAGVNRERGGVCSLRPPHPRLKPRTAANDDEAAIERRQLIQGIKADCHITNSYDAKIVLPTSLQQ